MTNYRLSKDAENDLREVARYTLDVWGTDIFTQYRSGLSQLFTAIGNNTVVSRQFSNRFPQLYVAKFRYHYIFYIKESNRTPLIIGVIHEKRDIVNRLSERLG